MQSADGPELVAVVAAAAVAVAGNFGYGLVLMGVVGGTRASPMQTRQYGLPCGIPNMNE